MVCKKCVLCDKFIKNKLRPVGNGKLLMDSLEFGKTLGFHPEITPESRICDKCRIKVCHYRSVSYLFMIMEYIM